MTRIGPVIRTGAIAIDFGGIGLAGIEEVRAELKAAGVPVTDAGTFGFVAWRGRVAYERDTSERENRP